MSTRLDYYEMKISAGKKIISSLALKVLIVRRRSRRLRSRRRSRRASSSPNPNPNPSHRLSRSFRSLWAVKVAKDAHPVCNLDGTGLAAVGSSIVREKSLTPMHLLDKR